MKNKRAIKKQITIQRKRTNKKIRRKRQYNKSKIGQKYISWNKRRTRE